MNLYLEKLLPRLTLKLISSEIHRNGQKRSQACRGVAATSPNICETFLHFSVQRHLTNRSQIFHVATHSEQEISRFLDYLIRMRY